MIINIFINHHHQWKCIDMFWIIISAACTAKKYLSLFRREIKTFYLDSNNPALGHQEIFWFEFCASRKTFKPMSTTHSPDDTPKIEMAKVSSNNNKSFQTKWLLGKLSLAETDWSDKQKNERKPNQAMIHMSDVRPHYVCRWYAHTHTQHTAGKDLDIKQSKSLGNKKLNHP